MKRTLVLNIVGLTPELIGEHTPFLRDFQKKYGSLAIQTITPAVTCSVQTTYLTGKLPKDHGIVGNGWYFRDLSEIWFWRQSNHLVQSESLWETAKRRDPNFTCAQLFWWYNMYNSADWTVTPRPLYPIDGRKIPDIYANTDELRFELNHKLGPFPLFKFWGPAADITSSQWIAQCALHIHKTRQPTLNLVYLPHLDYALQKYGPDPQKIHRELSEIDCVVKNLVTEVQKDSTQVLMLSEYGITPADQPIHINRFLREKGYLRIKREFHYEMLDPGASDAFAVSDHQVAHVYIRNPQAIDKIRSQLETLPGVESVWGAEEKREQGLDHPRSGELIVIAKPSAWFTYYFWNENEESKAPDYARTVDIHRKPGYDPVELFLNPETKWLKAKIAWKLLKKRCGFRTTMDLIPLTPHLVKGSHGRVSQIPEQSPLLMTENLATASQYANSIKATEIKQLILGHVFVERYADTFCDQLQ